MVAKIKSGKSLIGALNYNEHKVKLGKAKLISASLYPKSPEELSFDDKLLRLKNLADRNQRTKTNTLHLSLNFDLKETLPKEILSNIADDYMLQIGFGDQPYLVYQHFDAGHPHIHILTTNIDVNGSRISLHNIGRLKSESARKAIELKYDLTQAEAKAKNQEQEFTIQAIPLAYGSTDTKRAMTNIINEVARFYKFTSLAELNAVLIHYNMKADRGNPESVMYRKGGLRYWALDEFGNKAGVPIKASAIYKKPMLRLLEERFRLNEFLRKPFKDPLKIKIDKALKVSATRGQFVDDLKRNRVNVLFRENAAGRIFGITYVDFLNKTVFNGSDLGKTYSAAAVIVALQQSPELRTVAAGTNERPTQSSWTNPDQFEKTERIGVSLLDELLGPVDNNGNENLFERKKKKKRRKLNL